MSLLLFNMSCRLLPTQTPIPDSPVPLVDLLVDLAAYPPGWKGSVPQQLDIAFVGDEVEHLTRGFDFPATEHTNVAHHMVLRYRSIADAVQGFEAWNEYTKRHGSSTLYAADSLYTGETAQTMQIWCTHVIDTATHTYSMIKHCDVTARYGLFVSTFSAYIDTPAMSAPDFAHILEAIDQKMAVVATDEGP